MKIAVSAVSEAWRAQLILKETTILGQLNSSMDYKTVNAYEELILLYTRMLFLQSHFPTLPTLYTHEGGSNRSERNDVLT